ncbi:MAG: hypothetical protein ABIJ56_17800 [Pseudomonadota bacterium]
MMPEDNDKPGETLANASEDVASPPREKPQGEEKPAPEERKGGSSWKPALILTIAFYVIYGLAFNTRLLKPSPDNHFVYQADAFLNKQLNLTRPPPHGNDWVKYDNKWYVSFPPLPAIMMMPGVKIWGYKFNDRLFTFFFTPLPILFLFLALERLRKKERIKTSMRENIGLSILFGAGTVYFFVAVQGSVWFTAQVIGTSLLACYIYFALDGRRPLLAGLFLGLGFLCRTPVCFAFPLLVYEVLRAADKPERFYGWILKIFEWKHLQKFLLFAIFPAAIVVFAMVINTMRFDSPFEFGHRHLNVLWTSKFSKWGLFNYHFLARNLATVFTLLPWLSRIPPYITISNHGLAIWFTTPVLLYLLWPRLRGGLHTALWISVVCVAALSLFYQNTGWVQFGYRFSIDYMLFLVMLLAAGGRKLTKTFWSLVAVGIIINLFGAVTFGRISQFYSSDRTQLEIFQPD